jgi:hypothetical protein
LFHDHQTSGKKSDKLVFGHYLIAMQTISRSRGGTAPSFTQKKPGANPGFFTLQRNRSTGVASRARGRAFAGGLVAAFALFVEGVFAFQAVGFGAGGVMAAFAIGVLTGVVAFLAIVGGITGMRLVRKLDDLGRSALRHFDDVAHGQRRARESHHESYDDDSCQSSFHLCSSFIDKPK